MSATENDTAPLPPSPSRQDRTAWGLYAAVGLVVVLLIVFLLPNFLAVPSIVCLAIAAPAVLTVSLVCSTGRRRMFCIGALFPACTVLYAVGWLFGLCLVEPPGSDLNGLAEWLELFDQVGGALRVYFTVGYLLTLAVGGAAVWVHRRLAVRQEQDGHVPEARSTPRETAHEAPRETRHDSHAEQAAPPTEGSVAASNTGAPWQYSIKTLLVVTAATAVGLSIVVSSPDWLAVPTLILLAITIPALLTVVAVYRPGYQRTFCLAALFPTGIALYSTGWALGLALLNSEFDDMEEWEEWVEFFDHVGSAYRVYNASAWLLAIVVGSAAVFVRKRLEGRPSHDKSSS